ncbi:type II secretory pathway/ ATPase PulE/Tfp pilus assembly pathway/ ATPase PilB [Synechococcus sp. RS9902]|nr:type II secretory pathway/ ATPase PulE/Tfp pilus assembly pathway/ ATPase PilB [Synechococcus sp. RS9902]
MTLTLPTPDAGDTARQRFALELLLQQPVPGPEQLLESRKLLSDALPDVSPDQWRALQAMPIAIGADHLDIAIPSQWRDQEWQQLNDQLPEQHRTIRLHPAIEADLQRALATETDQPTTEPNPPAAEHSSNPAPAETASTLDLNAESFLHDFSPDEVLESEEDSDAQLARDALDLETSLNDAEASPVVTLVDRILLQAMSVGASDIHVEPQQKGLRLRFRQDGVLQQYVEPLPSRFGEKVCLRLLDSGATQLGLDKLIDDPDALALVRKLGSKPFGMILVTGPTGSGKSTTLYSLLAERNDPGINISTVEDPIEYTLPGITQCQVNRDKGFDFATALRAFMRQDPDVLLVGETRDDVRGDLRRSGRRAAGLHQAAR